MRSFVREKVVTTKAFAPLTSRGFFLYFLMPSQKKELKLRCRIDIDGQSFFGPGPAELLGLIERTGSISSAAREMGMSYKKAWEIISDLNKRGQKPFVVSQKGGEKGGGATLTPHGKEVVSRYGVLAKKLDALIRKEKKILDLI